MKLLCTAILIAAPPLSVGAQSSNLPQTENKPGGTAPRVQVYYGGKDLKLPQLLTPLESEPKVDNCNDNR